MQQTLTAKLQILPDERQRQILLLTMRTYADACSCVAQRIHTEDIPLSTCRIHQAVYRDLRVHDLQAEAIRENRVSSRLQGYDPAAP